MMEKDDNYTMRLPAMLKADFLAAAKANDRDGAQLIRDFMRSYVKANRPNPGKGTVTRDEPC